MSADRGQETLYILFPHSSTRPPFGRCCSSVRQRRLTPTVAPNHDYYNRWRDFVSRVYSLSFLGQSGAVCLLDMDAVLKKPPQPWGSSRFPTTLNTNQGRANPSHLQRQSLRRTFCGSVLEKCIMHEASVTVCKKKKKKKKPFP